jgi:hypothetical protein
VSLQCGATEELDDVAEPSRCEYTAVLRTPAACREDDVVAANAHLQELREMVKQVSSAVVEVELFCERGSPRW